MSPVRVVELYAGTGRSAEPFRKWPGAQVALLVDACDHARETYLLNHPSTCYARRVISRKTTSRAVESLAGGRVDVLLGCPPCQGFSDAGRREATDPRNAHLTHFGRIALGLRPRVIALENVPGAALSSQFARLVTSLEEAGYATTWQVVSSALAGSAQSRQRLLMIAFRADVKAAPVVPVPSHGAGSYFNYRLQAFSTLAEDPIGLLGTTPVAQLIHGEAWLHVQAGPTRAPDVGMVLDGLPALDSEHGKAMGHVSWPHKPSTLKKMEQVVEGGQLVTGRTYFAQAYGRLHRRGWAKTITTNFGNAGSGRFWHPTANRALTVREAARIQGFDDAFRFRGGHTANATLVGNALDASLANVVYEVARQAL